MMRLTSGASRKEPQASHATGEIAMPNPGTGYGPGLSVAERSARYDMAALSRTIDIYGRDGVGVRSEERRGGKDGASTGRSRWSPVPAKKKVQRNRSSGKTTLKEK